MEIATQLTTHMGVIGRLTTNLPLRFLPYYYSRATGISIGVIAVGYSSLIYVPALHW